MVYHERFLMSILSGNKLQFMFRLGTKNNLKITNHYIFFRQFDLLLKNDFNFDRKPTTYVICISLLPSE